MQTKKKNFIFHFFFFLESLKAPDTIQIDYNKINNIQFGY